MDELPDLIGGAKEGSRKLDALVARATGWGCVMIDPQGHHEWICWRKHYRSGEWIVLPHYTTKIDDALTLLPNGWGFSISRSETGSHCIAELSRSYPINNIIYAEGSVLAATLTAGILRVLDFMASYEGTPS